MAAPRSQPYRINWPSNVKISPDLQKALGTQFANIDECLQIVFTFLRQDADAVALIRAALSDVPQGDPVIVLMQGRDGADGLPGPPGASDGGSVTIAQVAARVALGI